MSTTTATDAPTGTAAQRITLATKQFCEVLGLGTIKAADLKSVELALLVTATDEIRRNAQFAERVREACRPVLAKAPKSPAPRESKRNTPERALRPSSQATRSRFSARAPADPYAYWDTYRDDRFHSALSDWHIEELKKAAEVVQQRHPGTKPKSKNRRADMIDYIVRHVTGQE